MAEKLFNDVSIANEAAPAATDRIPIFDPSTGKISYLTYSQITGLIPTPTRSTYTPTISWGGDDTGVTYSSQDGFYNSDGNICTFHAKVTVSAKGSGTGRFRFALPLAARSTDPGLQLVTVLCNNLAAKINTPLVGTIVAGTDYSTVLTQANTALADDLEDTDFDATFTVFIGGTYII